MKSVVTSEPVKNLLPLMTPRRLIPIDQPIMKKHLSNPIDMVIDAIREPILILDKNLTVLSVNTAMLHKFKIARKKILGKPIFQHKETHPKIKKLIIGLRKLSNTNSSFKETALTYSFEAIGELTLLINAKRIRFDHNQQDVILLTLSDITQRKLIEQQKDDFVGYVTHELKTPITSLSAFIQLLQGYHEKTGDKKSQFLLAKAAGQLERLIKL